ncbi:MAG: hypothetical protein KKF26_00650 [Chloroflexi bacterium]|nr:hypothetical protein [Chloroflexota bacterium]
MAELDTVTPVMEPEPAPPPEPEPFVDIELEPMVSAEAELELEVKPEFVAAEVKPEAVVEPEIEPVEPESKPKRKRVPKPEPVEPESKPKRKRAPKPEPESEMTSEVKAEAVAELESAVAELESVVASEAAEVKPEPKRRRKPAAAPEPESVAEPEPEPEPVMEADPEPAPETEIEPVAEVEAEPAEPESELTPGLIEVSIEGLYTAFAANKEAVDARYKGKKLKVTGLLYRMVINENLDVAYIILTSDKKYGDWKVSCTFSKEHEGELRRLEEEQMVTVQGNYDGYRANVQMRDCIIVR